MPLLGGQELFVRGISRRLMIMWIGISWYMWWKEWVLGRSGSIGSVIASVIASYQCSRTDFFLASRGLAKGGPLSLPFFSLWSCSFSLGRLIRYLVTGSYPGFLWVDWAWWVWCHTSSFCGWNQRFLWLWLWADGEFLLCYSVWGGFGPES